MKVYELLNSPNKWIQKDFAHDSNENNVWPSNKDAVCWCLDGALRKCYLNESQYWDMVNIITNYLNIDYSPAAIHLWNDAATYEDVINLCKELDI